MAIVRISVVSLALLLGVVQSAAAQMSELQVIGACAGYHQFWSLLSNRAGAQMDEANSNAVIANLDRQYGASAEYRNAKNRALQLCAQAGAQNNPKMIQSFAGFCVEKGLPIGTNRGR